MSSRVAGSEAPGEPILSGFVTPSLLASQLGISVRTLARWHAMRIGPPRCSVGRLILYRADGVSQWLAERETRTSRDSVRRTVRGGRS